MTLLLTLSAHLMLAAPTGSALVFEGNRGQAPAGVRYAARAAGHTVAFHDGGLRIFQNEATVELSFPGSRAAAAWEAREPVNGHVSYYVGNDPSRWVEQAPQFRRLLRRNLYPGIDLLFYGAGRHVEYDFVVHPGADASRVRLRVAGAQAAASATGDIEIVAGTERIRQRLPAIYQLRPNGQRMAVPGRFIARPDGDFALELGIHRPDLTLYVDPVLENASYLGGEADDQIVATGQGWFAGTTSSILFPNATRQRRRSRDVFLTFISQNSFGQSIVTRVFGGSGDDELTTAVTQFPGSAGIEAWLVGNTDSTDLPFANADNRYRGGARDGFWLRVPTGPNPPTGAYVGGAGDDRAHAAQLGPGTILVAGSTDSPGLATGRFVQAELAGGLDAFLATYASAVLTTPILLRFTYLGGRGDDQALSILTDPSSRIYLAGETRSEDFPGGNPLRGPSDGFLARIDNLNTAAVPPVLSISRLIGGSGEDRVERVVPQLFVTSSGVTAFASGPFYGEIALAGTTTSDDFPLTPGGGRPGGGSDAFVQRINPADDSVRFSARIGGSGDEDGRAVSLETSGTLALAGTTSSRDLPVVDAVQPQSGGGRDGYFVLWDSSNTLRQATYFGGAGDERVLALAPLGRDYRIAGETSSDTLPVRQQLQEEFGGGRDGFWADIGTSYLKVPSRLDVGKDMVIVLEVGLGQSGLPAVTVTSSDPARLRVSGPATRTAQFGAVNVGLEGLASEGEVELTVSAPGFGSRVIPVRLHPTSLLVGIDTFTTINTVRLGPPGNDVRVTAAFGVVDVARQAILTFGTLREGAPRPRVEFTSSDPTVAELGPVEPNSFLTPGAPSPRWLRLRAAGTAEIRGVSAEYPVWPEAIRIAVELPTVNPPANPVQLSRDLQVASPLFPVLQGRGIDIIGSPVTVRSENPDLVLVSVSDSLAGGASVTLAPGTSLNRQPIYLQAIGSEGETNVVVSSPGLNGETRIPVRVGPARLVIGGTGNSILTFPPTASPLRLSAQLLPAAFTGNVFQPYPLRPGASVPRVEVRSSDPRVATVSYGMNRFAYRGRDVSVPMLYRETGEATLSVTVSSAAFTLTGERNVRVSALPSGPITLAPLPAVEVGEGLQTSIQVNIPNGVEGTLSVLDPALASLVTGTAAPAWQVRLTASGIVAIYGLASSGETRLRLELITGQRVESTITLLPSTVVVNTFQPRIALPSNIGTVGLAVGWYALDDRTGFPLGSQRPQPGKTAIIQLKPNGNSIEFDSLSFTLTAANAANGLAVIPFRVRSLGVTHVDWELPAGLPTPARKAPVRIEIVPASILSSLGSRSSFVEHNTVTEFELPRISGQRITATSLDPTRLLLSSSRTTAGVTSLEDRPGTTIFLHGLVSDGTARLRLSSDGFESADLEFTLVPFSINSQVGQNGTVTMPLNSTLPITLPTRAIRPGAVVLLRIVSSSPEVARPASPTMELRGSLQSASFNLIGASEGETAIQIRDEDGRTLSAFNVRVERPSLTFTTPAVGKDMQADGRVTLSDGQISRENLIVTLTSLAPDRLLLSRPNANAAASIAIPVLAGSSERQFILHGLGDQGEVPVRITCDGFADSTVNVRLAPVGAVVYFDPDRRSSRGQTITGSVSLLVLDAEDRSNPRAPQARRPGVPPLTVRIVSSDPSIVAVETPSVTIAAGVTQASISVRTLNANGPAVVEAIIPEGLADPGDQRAFRFDLSERPFDMTCNSFDGPSPQLVTAPRGASIGCFFTTVQLFGQVLQARSLNPSLALVSLNGGTPGATASHTINSNQRNVFSIFGLAASGRATVELSGAGFETLQLDVDLAESYIGLASSSPIELVTGRAVSLPLGLRLATTGELVSPREFLEVGVGASSPAIRVTPASTTISNFTNNSLIRIEGAEAGTADIRFTAPAGFTTQPARVVVTRP